MLCLGCLRDWTQGKVWIFQSDAVELACVLLRGGLTELTVHLAEAASKAQTMGPGLHPWDTTIIVIIVIIILAFPAQCSHHKEGSWAKASKSFISLICCQTVCQEGKIQDGRPEEILLVNYLVQREAKLFQLIPPVWGRTWIQKCWDNCVGLILSFCLVPQRALLTV